LDDHPSEFILELLADFLVIVFLAFGRRSAITAPDCWFFMIF
jgi:hypothetical protein